ncbi:MAG TPA: efflux transporter outer membrane subunit [Variovorax sp.]|nr:efflux transporter outer membrane subunit [Variovorax sp.]
MHVPRFLAAFTATALLAGCAVGPDYRPPEPATPTGYQGRAALDARPATSSAGLDDWWTGFDDPRLTRFVTLALAQNLDLAQASARVNQARAGLGAARAALLPSGGVSAQSTRVDPSVETPLGRVLASVPGFDRQGELHEANATASWELDFFGGLRRAREGAQADYQAAEAGVAAARLAVAAQTADLYVAARGLQARLAIARRQVDTQEELLARVRLLYGKGLAAELQVRQAEGALAQARSVAPLLASGLEATANALDVMLGQPPGTNRPALAEASAVPAPPRIADTGSPGDLLRRRPDLMVAERRLAAASARIGVAVAAYYPEVSLTALVGSATSLSGGNLFTGGAGQAAGILGLRWRLFDFARIDAQIELAKGREAELLAAYRLAVLRATEDVENAFSGLVRREAQAVELDRAVVALARARQASWSAYQGGVVSLIEVLQADDGLQRASDARVQASTEAARAAIAAFRALGGGWRAAPTAPTTLAQQGE